MVVGFDHELGNCVEFIYPPVREAASSDCAASPGDSVALAAAASSAAGGRFVALPAEWKELPFQALPDGVHKRDHDAVFFTVPRLGDDDAHEGTQLLHAVSCYRQLSAQRARQLYAEAQRGQAADEDDTDATNAAITRNAVQKSVCVLCSEPSYEAVLGRVQAAMHIFAAHGFNPVARSALVELLHELDDGSRGASESACAALRDGVPGAGASSGEADTSDEDDNDDERIEFVSMSPDDGLEPEQAARSTALASSAARAGDAWVPPPASSAAQAACANSAPLDAVGTLGGAVVLRILKALLLQHSVVLCAEPALRTSRLVLGLAALVPASLSGPREARFEPEGWCAYGLPLPGVLDDGLAHVQPHCALQARQRPASLAHPTPPHPPFLDACSRLPRDPGTHLLERVSRVFLERSC